LKGLIAGMANNKLRLRIVTPSKVLYDNDVDMVIMRSTTGDIGILANHQPLTTTLDYGILTIKNGDNELKATVFGGFASVSNGVTVLSDAAEWPDEIDRERAIKAQERALNRIRSGSGNIDIARAELALKRANTRLELLKK